MSYEGAVVFVDGVHYAATVVDEDGEPDENGNHPVYADKDRPLRWTPDGYRDAEADEPLHNDVYANGLLELEVGGEE